MNTASTQDLRAVRVWPEVLRVLAGGPAPDERSQRAVNLVTSWMNRGSSRLDGDLDGKIDDPGAAVLDQSWDALAQAVLSPVLGDLVVPGGQLDRLETRDQSPRSRHGIGSSYDDGWYGYVRKDLRSLLGEHVRAPYSRRYCGNGDLAACRESLWAVIQSSADALAASQGTDPSAWRSDATAERIRFAPGALGAHDALDEPADVPPADGVRWPPLVDTNVRTCLHMRRGSRPQGDRRPAPPADPVARPRGELSAGEIAAHFAVTRPAVSQHLSVLKEAGLVDERRNGTRRLYRARPEGLEPIREFLEQFWDERLEALRREAETEERKKDGSEH